jgi:tetratricopeptide (TPR) repeat protein
MMSAATRRWQHSVVALILCGLTFAVYFQVRSHAFIELDDPIYITENPQLAAGFSWDAVRRAFEEPYETNWIPLTWISYHLDHALFGLESGGYQLVNAALHALSAVLLYLSLFTMTRDFWPSAFVAAIFAVHPVHVESVAWAAERKDTLSGVFWMLTLLAYARYAGGRRSAIGLVGVLLPFTLGLLAKPMLVSLPLVLLLLDYWPLGRLTHDDSAGIPPSRLGRCLAEKLPLVAVAAGVAWITFVVQSDAGAMANEQQLPLQLRVTNALTTCWIYLADSLWPSGLAIFYPHPMSATPIWLAALAAFGLVAVTAAALYTAKSRPYLIVGWLWYLVTLVPVIGIIQVGMQSRADRYLYLPQIGLTLALAWGAHEAVRRSVRGRRALGLVAGAAVLALTGVAWNQVGYWRDTATLYAHAVAVTEGNFVAHHGLAAELLEAGEPARAEPHFVRAIELKPKWASAHTGLGDARFAQDRVDDALVDYRRAVELAPRQPEGHLHLARALAAAGQPSRAEHHYRRSIELFETPDPRAHALLASLYAKTDQLARARNQYARAIELAPDYGEAHANLGFVQLRAQRYPAARESLVRALELGRDDAELHFGIGIAALEQGDHEQAVRHFGLAIERRPDWTAPANNLAWLLATHPDPALRNPLAAIEVVEGLRRGGAALDAGTLDTLAAAYAAAGRFREAAVTAAAAAQIAADSDRPELAREIEARLQLYRERRAFTEAPRPSAR